MAKKATRAVGKATTAKKSSGSKRKVASRKPVRASSSSRKSRTSDFDAVDALLNLLKSPLVADLLAVGATAAMAAITEARNSRRSGDESAKMMKAAGKAAAAAIGRRIANEFEEIRNVSKKAKASAKA